MSIMTISRADLASEWLAARAAGRDPDDPRLAPLDPAGRWPDLYERLSRRQRDAVTAALTSNWHEGWEPNRADVEVLVEQVLAGDFAVTPDLETNGG